MTVKKCFRSLAYISFVQKRFFAPQYGEMLLEGRQPEDVFLLLGHLAATVAVHPHSGLSESKTCTSLSIPGTNLSLCFSLAQIRPLDYGPISF